MIEYNTTKQSSPTLIVLCILTIIGNFLIILKGLLGYYILEGSNGDRSSGVIAFINVIYLLEFLSCIGAIVGAILMMSRKKVGLLVYQISSILYIILTAAFAFFCFLIIYIGTLIGLLQIFFLIISILFLVLYKKHEKYLS
jgi:hypothetical protein